MRTCSEKKKEKSILFMQIIATSQTMPNQISIYKTNIDDQIECISSLKEKLLNVTFYKE